MGWALNHCFLLQQDKELIVSQPHDFCDPQCIITRVSDLVPGCQIPRPLFWRFRLAVKLYPFMTTCGGLKTVGLHACSHVCCHTVFSTHTLLTHFCTAITLNNIVIKITLNCNAQLYLLFIINQCIVLSILVIIL